MGLKDLFFSITATDRTGTAFDSVAQKLRGIDGAAATASDKMERAGKAMRNVGAAASVGSVGIGALFRDVVGLYDTQARAEAKVEQAIRATGGAAGFTADELKKQASALQGVTRFGDESILNEVTAQLLTFKEISGDTFLSAQVAALDLATTLDGGLQGAAIMLGKALNDPAAGISALSRAGVTFTKDQKEVIKSLTETGNVAEAQRLILEEIASAYGGQAEAAREAGAGIVDAWSNTWGDLKEEVGKVILEFLPPVVDAMQGLATAFSGLSPETKRFAVVMGLVGVALPPVMAGIGALVIGISALSAPVLAAVAGVAVLTAGVVAFWPEIKSATEYLQGLWGEMSLAEKLIAPASIAVRALWDAFQSAFPNIAAMASEMVDGIKSALMDRLGQALDFVADKLAKVEGAFAWLYDKVVGNSWVPDLVDEVGAHFGRLDGEMVDVAQTAVSEVESGFKGLVGNVASDLGDLAREGKLTWEGFMGALEETGARYADSILDNVFGKLADGVAESVAGMFSGSAGSGGASGGGGGLGNLVGGAGGNFVGGLLGFATGGAFTVGGREGVDRNVAAVKLSRGEEVEVTRRGDAGRQPVVNVYISTPDPQSFRASRAQIGQQISRAVAAGARAG